MARTGQPGRSARPGRRAKLTLTFRKQAPAAVAPGYLLKGAGLQKLPDAK